MALIGEPGEPSLLNPPLKGSDEQLEAPEHLEISGSVKNGILKVEEGEIDLAEPNRAEKLAKLFSQRALGRTDSSGKL